MPLDRFPDLLQALREATAATSMNLIGGAEAAERMVSCLELNAGGVTESEVLSALKLLRKKRMFLQLRRVAEAYFHYDRPAQLRIQYAQALLDLDQLTGALSVLTHLLEQNDLASEIAEEARGLRGRAYKQSFVQAADEANRWGTQLPFHGKEALRLAVHAYQDAYERARHDRHWPAVNLVALLIRARADGIEVKSPYDPERLARQVLGELASLVPPIQQGEESCDKPWLLASGLEASLALRSDALTVEWGKRYLACAAADAFEFKSTLRQLTEVWRLHRDPERPAAHLLALLEAELLRKRGGDVEYAAGTRALMKKGIELEAIWGAERFQTHKWMKRAVACSDSVGRVEDSNGRAFGSGFLLRGRELNPAWGDEPVFVTNRHVVDDPRPQDGIAPNQAHIHFTTHDGTEEERIFTVSTTLWKSATVDPYLDAIVLRLHRPPSKGLDLAGGDLRNLRLGGEPPARLYVIGHPRGAQVSYSLYDNELHSLQEPYIYYRSPTLDGSSGSPIFDPEWCLLGLHHSKDHALRANRGSSLHAIYQAINQAQ